MVDRLGPPSSRCGRATARRAPASACGQVAQHLGAHRVGIAVGQGLVGVVALHLGLPVAFQSAPEPSSAWRCSTCHWSSFPLLFIEDKAFSPHSSVRAAGNGFFLKFRNWAFSAHVGPLLHMPPHPVFVLDSLNMATFSDLTFDSGLPANVDAEKTILGAILLDNAAHAEAAEKLEPDDFSLDSHRRIFLRMSELMDCTARRGHRHAGQRAGPLQGDRGRRRRRLPGLAHRGFAAPSGHRRVHPHRQGQEPAAQAHAHLLVGHRARRRPERVGAIGVLDETESQAARSQRKGPDPRPRSRSTRSSRTPSAPSTICTSRAARSPAWPRISRNSTA